MSSLWQKVALLAYQKQENRAWRVIQVRSCTVCTPGSGWEAGPRSLGDGRLDVGTHLPLLGKRYHYLSILGEGTSAQVCPAAATHPSALSVSLAVYLGDTKSTLGSTELQTNGVAGGAGSGHTATFTRPGCDQDTEATILICWAEGNWSPPNCFHSIMQPNWGLHHPCKSNLFAQESRALRWLASVAPYAAIARIQGVFFHANHICLVMPRLHQSLLDVVVHSSALDKDALVSQVRDIAMHLLVWLWTICVAWAIAFTTLRQFKVK